jgi:hypothetical protein
MAQYKLVKDSLLLTIKYGTMTKPVLGIISFICITNHVTAQYYYKDIISNKQLTAEITQLKQQKLRTISLKSFEDDGSPSEGFYCEKKINKSYNEIETRSRSYVTNPSIFVTTFNTNGQLLQTSDSSEVSSSTASYAYNANGLLQSIVTTARSSDDDFKTEIKEEHIYEYNNEGQPVKMVRVKNNVDSTAIVFSTDENGNIGIEKNTKTGDTYYYYYDAKKRLTDVVRLNPYNQKMLPDYMFEYNSAGLVTQMTTTEEGGSYYFIWKYTYDNGLRIREKCYSKEKRLMGTIEYEYK